MTSRTLSPHSVFVDSHHRTAIATFMASKIGSASMIKDLDLKDKTQKRLAGFAARIVTLVEKPNVQKNEPLVSVLDDLLGAAYALIAARQENFKGKLGKSEFAPILDRAKLIATAKPKNSGNWMAGFHFNSAMFRISAVFDRLPKSLAGCKHAEACCEHGAAARYQKVKGKAWQMQQLHDIRKEVNAIKHDAVGVYRGRKANLNAALAAVNQILELAEALT